MGIFSKKRIYADWAATTPIHPKVVRAMKAAKKTWANPSAIYAEGVEAKRALEAARTGCARQLGVKSDEVFFMSGGTEANATIIQGVLRMRLEAGIKPSDVHVVATAIEHSSILETLKVFESHGVKVTYIKPGEDGIVRVDDVLAAITPKTALVTVMLANNEIGTIQPVSKIGAGIRKIRSEKIGRSDADFPVFHTDASQAPLWMSCEIEGLRADAMTLDAHKMQGPKGVGALITRHHVSWQPFMIGGGQERGKRSTTESVELAAGFAEALEIAQQGRGARELRSRAISRFFLDILSKNIPEAIVNGSLYNRLPNNINISLPNISDPEFAVLYLDHQGIACSTKSSCLRGEENSYVVGQLGGESWRAKNTLRFTLAPDANRSDVLKIVDVLKHLQNLQK